MTLSPSLSPKLDIGVGASSLYQGSHLDIGVGSRLPSELEVRMILASTLIRGSYQLRHQSFSQRVEQAPTHPRMKQPEGGTIPHPPKRQSTPATTLDPTLPKRQSLKEGTRPDKLGEMGGGGGQTQKGNNPDLNKKKGGS